MATNGPAAQEPWQIALKEEAERIKSSDALGRSIVLIRLFDHLLDRSLEGQAPKEVELALELFSRRPNFDVVNDASVRVYVHRLRRKLEGYYKRTPSSVHMVIPQGEYRLQLVDTDFAAPTEQSEENTQQSALKSWQIWLALVALAIAVNLVIWLIILNYEPKSRVESVVDSSIWQPVLNKRPLVIVVGDYYIFGETPDGVIVTRLVRDFKVNSDKQLDDYLMDHPDMQGVYVDLGLHYLPTSTALALNDILPIVQNRNSTTNPIVIRSSSLTPTILRDDNIIYIGYFSGLLSLQNVVFSQSRFKLGQEFDDLIDKRTGHHYSADWGVVSQGGTPHRDYSYLARLVGPGGNNILIIAGTRDAGTSRAAKIAIDPAQLKRIRRLAGTGPAEALFEVGTMGNVDFRSRLVAASPIPSG